MPGRLADKVAVITGASRGLGQYCALGFGREGAKVVVAARTEAVADPRLPGSIHETAEMIRKAGGDAIAVPCNVASMESVEQMVEMVRWFRTRPTESRRELHATPPTIPYPFEW